MKKLENLQTLISLPPSATPDPQPTNLKNFQEVLKILPFLMIFLCKRRWSV